MKPQEAESLVWKLWPYIRAVVKRHTEKLYGLLFTPCDQDFAALDTLIEGVGAARAGKIRASHGEASVRSWLATRAVRCCDNRARDLIEEQRRRLPWLVSMSGDDHKDEDCLVGRDETLDVVGWTRRDLSEDDPLARLLLAEAREILDRSQPLGQSARIVAMWREGYSYAEISRSLGLSPDIVRGAIQRYRAAVRERALAMGYPAIERAVLKNL